MTSAVSEGANQKRSAAAGARAPAGLRRLRGWLWREWRSYVPQRFVQLEALVHAYGHRHAAKGIVGFGDSVWERVSRDDTDQRTYAAMLTALLPEREQSPLLLHHSGYHQRVFLGFVRALATLPAQPDLVILAINLRSFSPQWQFHPAWMARAEQRALAKYVTGRSGWRFIRAGQPNELEMQEYDATPVSYPDSAFTTVGEFRRLIELRPTTSAGREERTREIFRFHYMYPLDESNDQLRAIEKTMITLGELQVPVLCYITPINARAGERYLSGAFSQMVSSNVARLRKVFSTLAPNGSPLIDLSMQFDSSLFFHRDEPTEHLNQAGRMALAREVAARASSYLS